MAGPTDGIGDGLFHKTSGQVPGVIGAALKFQQVHYVGKGLAVRH